MKMIAAAFVMLCFVNTWTVHYGKMAHENCMKFLLMVCFSKRRWY